FYRPWSKALVVKVLERSFSLGAVRRRLESLWAKKGNIQVFDVSNSFFLVRFADHEDYRRAAFGGFMQLAVTRIGNYIGRTVRLDLATTEGARGRYARVCVEVDLSKPLLGKYMIENRTFLVEYESLENIYETCGIYGHKTAGCPNLKPIQASETQEDAYPKDSQVGCQDDVGEWMVVQRRGKNKGRKENKDVPKKPHPNSGTVDPAGQFVPPHYNFSCASFG
ncbi:hypothetical protein LINPERHAP1_LOCUS29391, partial [Linum perenne]